MASNVNLLNSKNAGSEEGPLPRILVANTEIAMLVVSEHTGGISNVWLHCPLIHAEAKIITELHVL